MNLHTSKALGMWERGDYGEEIGKGIKSGSQCKTEPVELGKQIIVDPVLLIILCSTECTHVLCSLIRLGSIFLPKWHLLYLLIIISNLLTEEILETLGNKNFLCYLINNNLIHTQPF